MSVARSVVCFWVAVLVCLPGKSRAAHIAGGEIWYDYNATSGAYTFYLRLFRDDSDPIGAPFDPAPLSLYVFATDGGTLFNGSNCEEIPITNNVVQAQVPFGALGACVPPSDPLLNNRIEDGVYTSQPIVLPPRMDGYEVYWARCCRNAGVNNLVNSGAQGFSWLTHVPGPNEYGTGPPNSSARFGTNVPPATVPFLLCQGVQVTIPQPATDPNGDQLSYRLINPYTGRLANFQGTSQTTPSLPNTCGWQGLGNYFPVPNATFFTPNFNWDRPFGPPPSAVTQIDPSTGTLTLLPPTAGIYTLAYAVDEFRNGTRINTTIREVQVRVLPCPLDAPDIVPDFSPVAGNPNVTVAGDVVTVEANTFFCFDIDIALPNPSETLVANPPALTGPLGTATLAQTGATVSSRRYQFCWEPPCGFSGQSFTLTFSGDNATTPCPLDQSTRTFTINVVPPDPNDMTLTPDLSSNPNVSDDTVFVLLDTDTACVDFSVRVPGADAADYVFSATGPPVNPGDGTVQISNVALSGDILTGTACWPGGCTGVNNPYPITLEAEYVPGCPPDNQDQATIFVQVVLPPNPPPVVSYATDSTNPSQLPLVNDTLFANINEELKFNFSITDINDGSTPIIPPVRARVFLLPAGNLLANLTPSSLALNTQTGNQQNLFGTFTWTTPCDYADGDEYLLVELQARDANRCGPENTVFDTFFVKLSAPLNPEPTTTFDLTPLTTTPGARLNGDTLFIFADSTGCYLFEVTDIAPAGTLQVVTYVTNTLGDTLNGVDFDITTTPTRTEGGTSLSGELCYTADCDQFGDTIALVLVTLDSIDCYESHRVEDTLWVVVEQPPNTPVALAVTDTNGDPIPLGGLVVVAQDSACIRVNLTDVPEDAQFGPHLSWGWELRDATTGIPITPLPGFREDSNAPDVNSLFGELCLALPCELLGVQLELYVFAQDNATCTLAHLVDTLLPIRVVPQPAPVPLLVPTPGAGIVLDGTTYVYTPRFPGCFEVFFDGDNATLGGGDSLSLQILRPLGPNLPALEVVVDTTGSEALGVELCWTPGCEWAGSTLNILLEGSTGQFCYADTTVTVPLTVEIREPENTPPVWSGTPPAEVLPGEEACFTLTLTDSDPLARLFVVGTSPSFSPDFGNGARARIVSLDTISPTELQVAVCFTPNCYQQNEPYALEITAYDSTNCDTTLTTPLTFDIPVGNCGLFFPNVFTPNGDGVNETFGPGSPEGVANYELFVFDRTGRQVYATTNAQPWNGQLSNGRNAAEGVYTVHLRWQLFSGTGPALRGEYTGHVTLLR